DYEGGEGEVDDSENEENKGGSEHSSSDLDSDEERKSLNSIVRRCESYIPQGWDCLVGYRALY
ncbi:AdoMet-dependent rRNA methyltransferase spb1, partial [Trifolium medium]|nr:AdoMet-dependent rRNA methyltransferase spb1 [Trifolium medium]